MRARRKKRRGEVQGVMACYLRVAAGSTAAFGYGFTSMEASYDEQ